MVSKLKSIILLKDLKDFVIIYSHSCSSELIRLWLIFEAQIKIFNEFLIKIFNETERF